jgi:hypothetical protein
MVGTATPITISSVAGLAGCTLLLVNVMMTAARARRYSLTTRRLLFLTVCVVAVLPVQGLSIAGYVRGVTGDVSVTTLILLVGTSMSYLMDRDVYDSRSVSILMLLVLGGGVFLYPLALGLTYCDPYVLGYGSQAFVASLFLVSLGAWYFDLYLVVVCVGFAISAYMMGIYESANLWDYLIDPLITFYALFLLAGNGIKRLLRGASSDARFSLTRKASLR